MQSFVRSILVVSAAAALAACSLIAAPDRDKIGADAGLGNGGGGASSGGASTGGSSSGTGGQSQGGGGAGGSAGTAGTAGGGADGGTPCTSLSDCPTPEQCWTATCTNSICGKDPVTNGTEIAIQTPGDCHKEVCDGAGAVILIVDDADPETDQNPCTTDTCNNGNIVHDPQPVDSPCGTNLKCDANGACVGCISPSDCPGQDNDCETRTCSSGTCGIDFDSVGTAIPTQVDGDCKSAECDGAGNVVEVAANDPIVDGKQCTQDLCNGTVPENPPESAGTSCSVNGIMCDGAGACVECVTDANCGTDTDCRKFHCSTAGACSTENIAGGTPVSTQTAGDCLVVVCNGSGGTRVDNDNNDVQLDSKQCTDDLCSSGTLTHPPLLSGTACNEGAGVVCDGSGNCVACVDGTTCTSKVCDLATHACSAPTCTDNTQNGSESDVDCGGTCSTKCANTEKCGSGTDCVSGICLGGFCAAPSVASTTPSGGTTTVSVATTITATFNVAMDPATLTGKVTLDSGPCNGAIQLSSDNFTTCIPFTTALATMSSSDTVATLTPALSLSYGTAYKIRITTAAHAAVGTAFGADSTTTAFTTEAAPAGVQNETGQTAEADYCVVLTSGFTVATGIVTGSITGAVREATVTSTAGASSSVTAEVGYGPRNKNPESDSGWTFVSAAYTQDATSSDEYAGTFTAPAAGDYGFVFRFSLDGGSSWTYCDLDGAGSEAGFGFDPTQIPLMHVTP